MSEHEREEGGQPPEADDEAIARPDGEDHRDGAPGYDLDEQSAIRELMDERGREGDEAG